MFEKILGNRPIKSYLQRALQENKLPQTLLFAGPEGIGKSLFARQLAAALLNTSQSRIEAETHPDFHIAKPEGKSGFHPIESLRTLIDQVREAPFEADRKVFLIQDAERMQAPSANALLKTLEEPNLDATLILLTHSPHDLLPTILSRCIRLNFQPLSEAEISSLLAARGHPPLFAKAAHGSASVALLLASDPSYQSAATLLLGLLSHPPSYPTLADQLEQLESLLDPLKEEDPVAYHRRVDLLFATLLMWTRDQHARLLGAPLSSLFLPEAPLADPRYSLVEMEELLQTVRTSFQRNIKLSTCLELVFLSND